MLDLSGRCWQTRLCVLLVENLSTLNPKNNSIWEKNACSFPLRPSNGSGVLNFKSLIMTGAGAGAGTSGATAGATAGACPRVLPVVNISKPVSKGK